VNLQAIANLQADEIAFPQINYDGIQPLQLPRTTLLAAYRNIENNINNDLLEGLNREQNGDVNWQNTKLNELYWQIDNMIQQYRQNNQENLLMKIFVWIQLWGGNAGRSTFIRGGRWENNFSLETYRNAIEQINQNNYQDALIMLNTMYGIYTSFSTKHLHFWSDFTTPIYDQIIAAIVFGRKHARSQEFFIYNHALETLINDLGNNQVTKSTIERNLFNWAHTDAGKSWINIRLNNL
jgi:hypothetical protein